MLVKGKWPLKVFLPLKVIEADGRISATIQPSVHLPVTASKGEGNKERNPGQTCGYFRGMLDFQPPPLLPSVAEVLLCVLVVVNEAILNTVMKMK